MGSKFLGLYVCDQKDVNKIVGSGVANYINQLSSDNNLTPYLEKLIDGDYSRHPETHEAPEAHHLIYAFEKICKKECSEFAVLEVYIDEDETPELWNFHLASWSEPDELKLPLSEYGSPMVTFLDAITLAEHEQALLNMANVDSRDEGYISDEDLASLLKLIATAISKKLGIYLFYNE